MNSKTKQNKTWDCPVGPKPLGPGGPEGPERPFGIILYDLVRYYFTLIKVYVDKKVEVENDSILRTFLGLLSLDHNCNFVNNKSLNQIPQHNLFLHRNAFKCTSLEKWFKYLFTTPLFFLPF